MSTSEFTTPRKNRHNRSRAFNSPKSHHLPHLRFSRGSPIAVLHAPTSILSKLHRHEQEMVINHEGRKAKRDAESAIGEEEASCSRSPNETTSTHSPHKSKTITPEDEVEWAAILAARKATTTRSATPELEKEMATERERKLLEEQEMEDENQRRWN